jgi:hypothetical protein
VTGSVQHDPSKNAAPQPVDLHKGGVGGDIGLGRAASEAAMIRKLSSGEYRLYSRKKDPRLASGAILEPSARASGREARKGRAVSSSGTDDQATPISIATADPMVVR